MTNPTYTQLELPFPPASETTAFQPYLTIDGKDAMEDGPTLPSEDDAARALFFNLHMMTVMLGSPNTKFELTRRDEVSFTAYLYTEEQGAQVVRGGIKSVAQ